MNSSSGLHTGEINCLVPRLLEEVRWLGVFARDELPDVSRESRPWCLILNTDPKDQPGRHWLALYAPTNGLIKLFDSFGFSPSTYNLDSLHPLYLAYTFQSLNSSVCGHYCIVYLFLRSRHKSLAQIYHLFITISNRDVWIKSYVNYLQCLFSIRKPCQRTGIVN